MKKFLLSGLLFFVCYAWVTAQTENFRLLRCIDSSGSYVVNDPLGNLYILEKSSLKKYDEQGNFLCSYSDLSDGLISGIDVSDPLKIIIVNADFAKIKFLDNKLNVKNTAVSLSALGYANTSLVAASYESGFWIFDPLSGQLIRFDKNLQQTHASGSISDLTGLEIRPVFMLENNNTLYLNDPNLGVLLFDRYATYLKTIPVKELQSFQVFNEKIFYLHQNVLHTLDVNTYEEKILKLPAMNESIVGASISNARLSLITKTKCCIYLF